MKTFFKHTKKYIIAGLLALVPIWITYLTLKFIYLTIDRKIVILLKEHIGFTVPGEGLLIFLLVLYLVGVIARNAIGRYFFNLIERITERIPIVKWTYQLGKQISSSFSLPEKQSFKYPVLANFFKDGTWNPGFVTGEINDPSTKEKFLKVYVPTTPNPTSGFVALVKETDIRKTGWTTEEAMKLIISAGIISPTEIRKEQRAP